MFWDKVMRWVRGYVVFEGEGGTPETLSTRARAQGIDLWNTRFRKFSVRSSCTPSSYRRLRGALRHSGMRVRICRKVGAPFLVRGYRRRYGLLVGAVLGAVMLGTLPQYVWVISVEGNVTVPAETIMAKAETLGVRVGMRWDTLDMSALRLQALTAMPELAWFTVNPEGSVARIVVKEREAEQPPDDGNTPSHLVAAYDGVVLRVVAERGYPAVKQGEAVTAGDRLVSGIFEAPEFWDVTRSSGEVWAVTERCVTVSVPLKETVTMPSGKRCERMSFCFLGWEVPLYTSAPLKGEWRVSEQDGRLVVRGTVLPLGIWKRTYTAYVPREVKHSVEEATALARHETAVRFLQEYPTAAVIEQAENVEVKDGVCFLKTVFTCEENIAKEVPIGANEYEMLLKQ